MDRMTLVGLGVLGLVAAFWFLVLSPKRDEAATLETEVGELQVAVAEAEKAAAEGEEAKRDFSLNYRRVVTMGKAVPKDADTSSLLIQLETLSNRSGVDFRGITLEEGAGGAAAAAATAPAPPETPDESATPATTTAPGAVPTESTAALLPIGATVGTAGLPVMPYSLEFQGGFFEVAAFFGRLDDLVDAGNRHVRVDGRLLTIDGFSLDASPDGFPSLTASVQASSYLTPSDQGVTAGATPTAPASTPPPGGEPAPPSAAVTPAPLTP